MRQLTKVLLILASIAGTIAAGMLLAPSFAMSLGAGDKELLLMWVLFFTFTTLWTLVDSKQQRLGLALPIVCLVGCIFGIITVLMMP